MADPAHILQRLHEAGFDFQTFDRFPRAVGVSRNDCIVLLEANPDGFRILGMPGWKMGEAIGVLTTSNGRQVFQAKSELVDATPERLTALSEFRADLERLMAPPVV